MSEETQPAEAAPASPAPAPAWRPSYWFLAIVTLVTLVADIATKQWIKRANERWLAHRVELGHPHDPFKIKLIDGYASLIYANNKGGAWGILQGEHESLRRPFFLVVSVAAIVFIISLYKKLTPGQRALKWGLPLVLGGALGNLIDRIVYGWVIDFIDCFAHKGTLLYRLFSSFAAGASDEIHWPTFNVADIAICVGVGLMAVDMFTSREKVRRDARDARSDTGPTELKAAEPPPPAIKS